LVSLVGLAFELGHLPQVKGYRKVKFYHILKSEGGLYLLLRYLDTLSVYIGSISCP